MKVTLTRKRRESSSAAPAEVEDSESPRQGANHQAHQRVIFLTGAARSGTTWLATILNSFSGVVYSHEPLRRVRGERLERLVREMIDGRLSQPDAGTLKAELCKSRPDWRRRPFFKKNGRNWPAALESICWSLVRSAGRGDEMFCRLFSPDPGGSHHLLIKEVDWARHLEATIRCISADVIWIIRHPCAVVASLRKGQRLGLMPVEERRLWLRTNEAQCLHVAFNADSVLAMRDHEFLALNWLLQNLTTQRVLEGNPRAVVVVYEELCKEPLRIAESLFEFLGWPIGHETREFIEVSTGARRSFLGALRPANYRYFGVYRSQRRVRQSWKTRLSGRDKAEIMSIAGRLPGFRNYWSS
jgi:hypothetical protein